MTAAKSVRILPLHFILRRLHSLAGLLPVSVFLLEHIFTNSYSLIGAEAYNAKIEALQGLPFVVLIEILFIFVPIAFHAIYGFVIIYEGRTNVHQYGFEANWRYTLQRITGIVGITFVAYHVYATRFTSYMTDAPMSYMWMQKLLADPVKVIFYLIGSTSLIFHFANGLWTGLIVWGVTISPASQRLSLKFAWLSFLILASINTLIILNFAYPDSTSRPAVVGAVLSFVKVWFFGTLK